MPIQQLSTYLLVYIVPALALFAMACMVIAKNYKRTENQLVALIVLLYSVLFFGEFVRHLIPLSYSGIVIYYMTVNVGILIYSAYFHFYSHITNLRNRLKIPFYPLIFYIPFTLIVTIKLLKRDALTNTEFIQDGFWMIPVSGSHYYLLVTISSILLLFLFLILLNGLKHATSTMKYRLIRLLAIGNFIAFLLNILIGYRSIELSIPPFPVILIGILLTVFLSMSVFKFQMFPSAVKRYQTMFNLSPLSIIVLNSDLYILEFNEMAGKDILFYGHENSKFTDLAKTPLNKEVFEKLFETLNQEKELQDYQLSFEQINSESLLHYAVDASTVLIEDKVLYYTIWRNVTEELEKERLIEKMAYHDGLTGLHNRTYFVKEIKKRLMIKKIVSLKKSAVVLIDLNRFKLINDTYGHAIGDDVLRETASILSGSVRQNDLVARIGGDEFILFLDEFPTEESINEWESRLRDVFKQRLFTSDSITIQIEISIGIAYFPVDGKNFEELFQSADLKMYEDKLLSRMEIEIG